MQKTISNAREWLADKRNLAEQDGRMREAINALLELFPWFGMRIALAIVSFDHKIKTACTDGKNIKFNPLMVACITIEEIIFILAHEALHIALFHHLRRGNWDHGIWNAAGDYVINALLVKSGLKIPEGALYDPRFDGMSTEQVAAILTEEAETEPGDEPGEEGDEPGDEPGDEQGDEPDEDGEHGDDFGEGPTRKRKGQGDGDEQSDDEGDDEGDEQGDEQGDEPEGVNEDGDYELPKPDEWGTVTDAQNDEGDDMNDEEKAEASIRVVEDNAITSRTEKQIGKGTNLFGEALAHELNKSKHDWKKELKRFMTQAHRKGIERTWSRVNRRAVHRGEYQQGIDNQGHGEMVIAVDASSSMTGPEFQVGLDAVAAVAKMLKPEMIHFIQWTDIVLSHEYIKPGGNFEVERKGSGGTEFAPILHHIKYGGQLKKHYFADPEGKMHKPIKNPTVIICLTDMHLDWKAVNANKPKAPVIFVDCYSSACDVDQGSAQSRGCNFKCKTITVTK